LGVNRRVERVDLAALPYYCAGLVDVLDGFIHWQGFTQEVSFFQRYHAVALGA